MRTKVSGKKVIIERNRACTCILIGYLPGHSDWLMVFMSGSCLIVMCACRSPRQRDCIPLSSFSFAVTLFPRTSSLPFVTYCTSFRSHACLHSQTRCHATTIPASRIPSFSSSSCPSPVNLTSDQLMPKRDALRKSGLSQRRSKW